MKTDATTNATRRALLTGKSLGRAVKSARLARNLPQDDLAERARVSRRTLQRIEAGEVAVALGAVLNVLEVLGLLGQLDAVEADASRVALESNPRKRAVGSDASKDLDF